MSDWLKIDVAETCRKQNVLGIDNSKIKAAKRKDIARLELLAKLADIKGLAKKYQAEAKGEKESLVKSKVKIKRKTFLDIYAENYSVKQSDLALNKAVSALKQTLRVFQEGLLSLEKKYSKRKPRWVKISLGRIRKTEERIKRVLNIFQEIQNTINELPKDIKKTLLKKEASSKQRATIAVTIDGIEKTIFAIGKALSKPIYRLKIDVGLLDWEKKLTAKKVNSLLEKLCKLLPKKKKPATQPPTQPATQSAVPKYEYPYLTHKIKIRLGYQHLEAGADDVQVMPTEELGLVPNISGSIGANYDSLAFGAKLDWKMSYDTTGYDPKGQASDQSYFNNQLFASGWFKKAWKNFDLFVEAGFLTNEKVYPTMEHQNLSGIGMNIKSKIKINDFFGINPDLYLAAGERKNNVQLDPSDFSFSDAGAKVKLDFVLPSVQFFVKGGIGVRPGQESVPEKQIVSELSEYEVAGEAVAGIGINPGNHQLKLNLAYRNNPLNPTSTQDIDKYRGFSTELIWNHSSLGIGAKIFYNNTEGRNIIKAGASWKFLTKDIFWKQKASLGLFANFAYTTADQYVNLPFKNLDGEAIGVGGGLEISIEREKPIK